MTRAELFLRPRDSEELDPRELVPPVCHASDFLKIIHLFDPELEVGLYSKLEGQRLDPQGRALGRQSQESDDEGVEPSAYCSGGGGDGCWMGADRCRRQRKAERLRALVDLLVEKCKGKIEQEFAVNADGPLHRARLGDYTREEAEQRVAEFKQNADRQLALMAIQRSTRAVEIKRLRLRTGVYEVPGEGLPIWRLDDVRDHVVEQVQLTDDWIGERVATEDVDDITVANDCALRPKARPEPESLTRQCEYSKAAAIMVKTMELVKLREGDKAAPSSTALWLVPSLLEEYLKLCGLAEFAPTRVGCAKLPDAAPRLFGASAPTPSSSPRPPPLFLA